ncbi:MAG: putative molybdenum carrier protein [Deltaproteobacteria bacterium]|nr:putative molybdenum carrier protein [Deltaproteobacteria bacterium]MBW1924115.1 putative molybdenum carrier protein [Deltaproteobacteria bacterium]MBW1949324.1 putative molybdenum carrier protein [Deltaproteobacteria bacterium]MBW2008326.1 putative molybdenum carrier protein [Deltaproteobacteria bacterium]
MSGTEQKAREHQTVPHKIISGGQTGADRAALDFALDAGIPHGGWVPRGRLAEDGPLPARYAVQEIDRRSYAARTEKNVLEADGTLILSHGKLTGGSALTRRLAKRHERPWLHLDLERIGAMDAATSLQAWIEEKGIRVLNVAGPRASQDPRIYEATRKILKTAYHLGLVAAGTRGPWSGRPDPPTTVRDAVQRLASEMTLKDRVTVSRMAERDLRALVTSLVPYIRRKYGLSRENPRLIQSCRLQSGENLDTEQCAAYIVRRLWSYLKRTHGLRAVK